ncbi:MAG: cysteine desulfurase, partial [Rhodospirillales bacterium]|nr:cysteine desulfurase [Rhodospirillales bacterium]
YLDNAATAQIPQTVIDAITAHETTHRANVTRGVHALAEAATEAYEGARHIVARYMNATADSEVVFTYGTTSAINLAAHALGEGLGEGDEIVLSVAEHHANLVPWLMLRERRGVTLRFLPVTDEGRIDLSTLDNLVRERCKVITLTHCSNVTGAITDFRPVVAAARAVGAKVLVDGAQMAPKGQFDASELGADLYAFSGHKVYGPNGIGVLWGRRDVLSAMPPFMGGGGMIRSVSLESVTYGDPPKRFEAGTPPIAQAVGLGAALNWVMSGYLDGAHKHMDRLTLRIIERLQGIPGARLVGPANMEERVGVVSFALDGLHPHDIAQILDRHGVAVRGGHHCAEPLMTRFGLTGTARASLAPYNTDEDVDALFEAIEDALRTFSGH